MKIIPIIILALTLALAGCMLTTLGAIHQNKDLSPEQIKTLQEANMNVYGCFQIGGPPPIGNTTWIVYPKGEPAPVLFLPNCAVQMR